MDTGRLSACTVAMRQRSLDNALRVVAEAGFRKVDLWGGMPHFSINGSEYSVDGLMELADGYGLRIANLGTYCGRNFSSLSKAKVRRELQDMKSAIDIARKVGARSIRVVPGSDKRRVMDRIVPHFRESAEYAEEKGVYLGFENHGGSISGDPDACVELCEKVNSGHFGVLYDPCNLLHVGVDYKDAFARFHTHIVHVHLKDGAPRGRGKFRPTMLGDGVVEITWVVESLYKAGYAGDFALEYEVSHIEPAETGLKKWFEYCKAL